MHGEVRMRPSVEALEEFRVEAAYYNADLGTQSGAQIISAIRPGSNTFHGTVFQFLRNDVLDARNFFENPASPKKPLRRNNFGAVLSGRIIRDKLFFTTNYEGYIERSSSQAFGVYPTDAMKQGDLTAPFFHAGGNPNNPLMPIRDALNSDAPFPNNQIPSNRIVTQSQKLMQYFLEPNLLGPFTGSNNYSGQTIANTDDHQGVSCASTTISIQPTACLCGTASRTSQASPSQLTRTRSSAKASPGTRRTWSPPTRGQSPRPS